MTLGGEQPLPALLAQVGATLTECARAKGVELRPRRAVAGTNDAGTNDSGTSSAVRAVVASAIANVLNHAFQRHVASVSWSAGGFDRFRDSGRGPRGRHALYTVARLPAAAAAAVDGQPAPAPAAAAVGGCTTDAPAAPAAARGDARAAAPVAAPERAAAAGLRPVVSARHARTAADHWDG